jgi:hypothetical protein
MYVQRKRSSTSNILRTTLRNSSTGAGLTGLTSASSGLIISTICDNEATATAYTAAGSTIESITTLGTFAAPTATKCRFKEVDSTNHPGLYEFQFADARFAVASSKVLRVTISGATSLLSKDIVVQLTAVDPDSATNFGLSALPTANAAAADGIMVNGTNTGTPTFTGGLTVNGLAAGVITNASLAADSGLKPIRVGTAQAGDAFTVTLDAGASSTDNFYTGQRLVLTGGTGAGQSRIIQGYTGTSKVALLTRSLVTAAAAASTFAIIPATVDVDSWAQTFVVAPVSGYIQVDVKLWADTDLGPGSVDPDTGSLKVYVVDQATNAVVDLLSAANRIATAIPDATAGAAGGLFIAGTNAATTITTSLTTTFTGNLTGSVGSVTGVGGSGARSVAITVDDGTTPIEGAIGSLHARASTAISRTTDSSGIASFALDEATYTVTITAGLQLHAGHVRDHQLQRNLDAYLLHVGDCHPPAPAIPTRVQLLHDHLRRRWHAGDGRRHPLPDEGKPRAAIHGPMTMRSSTATSDDTTGLLTVDLVKGAIYVAQRGSGAEKIEFTVGTGSTFELPGIPGPDAEFP